MRTKVCELLGIDYPIVGFTPSHEVAAAITRAGGFGVLGAIRFTSTDDLKRSLDYMHTHTDGRPWGLDIVMPNRSVETGGTAQLDAMIPQEHREFVESLLAKQGVPPLPKEAQADGITAWMHNVARAQVEIALEYPIKLIANALGSPPVDIIQKAHERGVLVAALAGKAKHAVDHKNAGVDIIVSQGHEAGGHTGEVTTMVLVPEIVEAVRPLPVLAAGGIGTGHQIAAALALGAEGVWLGSLWLTSKEYQLESPIVIEKLLRATSSDTVRSKVISGKPARMLRTEWTDAWEGADSPGTLPMPLQGHLVAEAQARIRHHQTAPFLGTPVGQIVGAMNAVEPVDAIVRRLLSEYKQTMNRLASLS